MFDGVMGNVWGEANWISKSGSHANQTLIIGKFSCGNGSGKHRTDEFLCMRTGLRHFSWLSSRRAVPEAPVPSVVRCLVNTSVVVKDAAAFNLVKCPFNYAASLLHTQK